MKNLIYLFSLFLFLSQLTMAQKPDSVVISTTTQFKNFVVPATKDSSTTTITVTKTVYKFETGKDSIVVTPPPPPIPQNDSTIRGCYDNKLSTWIGNKTLEDARIKDYNRFHFNFVSYYDVSGADRSKLQAWIHRVKTESTVKDVQTTGGNGSSFTGDRTAYNVASPTVSDFTSWNLEFEAYNQIDVAAAWTQDKTYVGQMKSGMTAGQVNYITQYFGWWTKAPMNIETPAFIVANLAYGLLHDYTTTPSFSYLLGRLKDLDNAALKDFNIIVLFSAEPAFMQDYLKTHTLDQAYAVIQVAFKAAGFKHLKLIGYMVFTLDHLRVASPTPVNVFKSVARLFKNKNVPDYAAPGFKNETDSLHLLIATSPEE